MIKKGAQKELYGYTGKLLRIDLSSGTSRAEELDPEKLRAYIGGIGIGVSLLYDELSPGIDPLGPENKMVFATGPFTGTRAPGSGFVAVCFKSPLTGIWGECRCGSDFGRDLRRSGYDSMVLEGKAKEPSYVAINDGKVDIKAVMDESGSERLEGAVPMLCEAGDVFITNRQLVHGSFANSSPDRRVTLNAGWFPRRRVLDVTTTRLDGKTETFDAARINERCRLIAVAADARQQRFPDEPRYCYQPLSGQEDENRWSEEARQALVRDYNLQDFYI